MVQARRARRRRVTWWSSGTLGAERRRWAAPCTGSPEARSGRAAVWRRGVRARTHEFPRLAAGDPAPDRGTRTRPTSPTGRACSWSRAADRAGDARAEHRQGAPADRATRAERGRSSRANEHGPRAAVLQQRDLHGPPAGRHDRGEPGSDGSAGRRPRGAGRVRHGRRFSYPEFVAEVDACALGLDALGVRKGDRVGIWAPNCAEWAFVQYGTAKLGAILVNINPAYRTHELSYVLKQAGISVLVSRAGVQDQRLPRDGRRGARRVPRAARGAVPRRPRVGAAAGHRPRRRPRPAGASARPSCRPTTRSTSSTPRGRRASPRARRSPTTTCSTTGSSSARAAATPRPTASASRCPTTTASAWAWATSAATSHGATMVIPAPGFDPALTLQAVQDEKCTSLYGVPTMFIAELGAARTSPTTTCPACAPASWPARRARSR